MRPVYRTGVRLLEANRAGSLFGEHVAGVGQRAGLEAQAAAADAAGEVVAQPLDVQDAVVEVLAPLGREFRPVLAGGDAIVGQRPQRLADAGKWDSEPLRHPDERDTPQRLAGVSALVSAGASAGDEAFPLVEVQRRHRDTTA